MKGAKRKDEIHEIRNFCAVFLGNYISNTFAIMDEVGVQS